MINEEVIPIVLNTNEFCGMLQNLQKILSPYYETKEDKKEDKI